MTTAERIANWISEMRVDLQEAEEAAERDRDWLQRHEGQIERLRAEIADAGHALGILNSAESKR